MCPRCFGDILTHPIALEPEILDKFRVTSSQRNNNHDRVIMEERKEKKGKIEIYKIPPTDLCLFFPPLLLGKHAYLFPTRDYFSLSLSLSISRTLSNKYGFNQLDRQWSLINMLTTSVDIAVVIFSFYSRSLVFWKGSWRKGRALINRSPVPGRL